MKKHFSLLLILFCAISIDAQKDSIHSPKVKAESDYRKISSDKIPEFPGGHAAFMKQIINNFNTTPLWKQNIARASAIAVFDIDKEGNMINLRVESYDYEAVKTEFLRALNKVKTKWVPGEQNGEKVKMRMRQPLQFNLE
ncbi:hypothetical protein [Chryseobacterium indoltheticum]|uniref:hypothetical protein n=1 Tax=Chryseobacterium indoltheticum TaxID=254 RepID=UPI003F499B05